MAIDLQFDDPSLAGLEETWYHQNVSLPLGKRKNFHGMYPGFEIKGRVLLLQQCMEVKSNLRTA